MIRERFRLKQEIRIQTAQGRLTGWMLSLLPDPSDAALFHQSGSHQPALDAACRGQNVLDRRMMTMTGGLIIRKIVRIRV